MLPSTRVWSSTASLPFEMPPAAMGGPSPGPGGPAVAVFRLTSLWLSFSSAGPVLPPLAFPLTMPPPCTAAFPLTWVWRAVTDPSKFWMPPPLPFGAVLSFTLLWSSFSTLSLPEKLK